MSPLEPITGGQIGKIGDLLGAQLRKKEKEFPSETVQQVIINQGKPLAEKLLAVVREFVDAASNMITRIVTVNRTRTPKEALKATGRTQYVDATVVAEMPRGKEDETEIVFFKLGRFVSNDDLDKEYELRGLEAVDPCSLAAHNEADPAFADKYPNGTQWKDAKGKWCIAAFDLSGGRGVRVDRGGGDWSGGWWFAGVRKVSSSNSETLDS